MPHHTDSAVFQIGGWQFDIAARSLTDGVRTRRLTPKAAAVLATLAEADGHVVNRTELLDRVWPDSEVCEEVLTHSVAEIRRAMGDSGARRIIETVHGTGYRVHHSVRTSTGDVPPWPADCEDDFDLDAFLDCREARRLCERAGERALGPAVALCGMAAARAPRCAPVLSEFAALAAMRYLYSDERGPGPEDSLSAADRAVALRPDLACGHVSRGVVLAALGRKSATCAAFNKAIARDPQDFQAHYHYARALFAFRDYSQAARIAECAAALQSDDYRPLYVVAASRSALGEAAGARSAAETGLARVRLQLSSAEGGNRAESALGLFLALSGRYGSAYRCLSAQEPKQDTGLYYGAAAYAALGAVDSALDRLEGIVDHGFRHVDWLRADPTLEQLRSSPRYRRFIAALDPA